MRDSVGIVFIAGLTLAVAWESRAQDRDANGKAFEKLKTAIDESYSYRDRLKVDWKKRFEEFELRFLAATGKEEFIKVAVEFLGAAKDPHLWIKDGNKIIGTHKMELKPNINPRLLPKLMPQVKQIGRIAVTGEWPDGVRYVAIGTWDDRDSASMKAVSRFWSSLTLCVNSKCIDPANCISPRAWPPTLLTLPHVLQSLETFHRVSGRDETGNRFVE